MTHDGDIVYKERKKIKGNILVQHISMKEREESITSKKNQKKSWEKKEPNCKY